MGFYAVDLNPKGELRDGTNKTPRMPRPATKPGQTWEKEEGQLRLDTCHLTVVNCPELNYLLNKPMQDLEGITVVSVEQAVAAPYASVRLAQAGARVIKVERPEGDFARRYDSLVNGDSAYFVWLNHGKESICIDLKQADEKSLLQKLIASADVFIQNLAPGAAKRLGFGAEELQQRYPSLIYCTIWYWKACAAIRCRCSSC